MSNGLVLLPVVLAFVSVPATVIAGALRVRLAGTVAVAFAGSAFLAALYAWFSGGGTFRTAWVPARDFSFAVTLDGFALLYTLLATGVGCVVLVYSRRYLPLHLEHQGRNRSEETKFFGWMLLFMAAMVGLAMARDLVLLFVFWDITAVASYYLIGFDRQNRDARASALMALLVTGVTAVCLLIGALLLYGAYGTFSVPELSRRVEPGALLNVAGALITVAALAKSAQVPFHFWLPKAMAAPSPVSAYLHSAAMVAAGVLLIGRVYPLLRQSQLLLDVLLVVGLGSIIIGAVLALTRDVLKQLLAYSTVSQYGYVVFMYGLGGKYGAAGAAFYVVAHALAKSALFLLAGTVTETTGQDRLSRLGGLGNRLPLLAVAGGVASAGVIGLPLTVGFFADELLFEAALERGTLPAVLAVAGAVLTLAYMWRFWSGIFLRRPPGQQRAGGTGASRPPPTLVWPIVALAGLVFAGGWVVEPFARLAQTAGAASFAAPTPIEPAYHFDARSANLMVVAMVAGGLLMVRTHRWWHGGARAVSRLGAVAGPARLYESGLVCLNRFSDRIHQLEVRDLRGRVAAVLVPGAVLVGAGILAAPAPTLEAYRVGAVQVAQLPLLLALMAATAAALATTVTRRHITLALVLSSSGFVLALVYAFFGAPEVALVAVLVETLLTLFFLGASKLIPVHVLRTQAELPVRNRRRIVFSSVVAGAAVFAVVWGALSQPAAEQSVAERHVRLTPEAHASDIVTAILADFRGLDTLGEITVVAIVLLGVGTLLGGGRLAAPNVAQAEAERPQVLPRVVGKLILVPTLLVAVALLVKGYSQTGDGFSAGVVAGLGVALQYILFGRVAARRIRLVRFAGRIAFGGLLLALGVAGTPIFLGEPVLTHYPPPGAEVAHFGAVEFITAVLFDVGVFLLVFGFVVATVNTLSRAIAGEERRRCPDPPGTNEVEQSSVPAGRERQ